MSVNTKVDNFLKEILTEGEYKEIIELPHLSRVREMYSEEYIDSVEVIPVDNKRFVIRKEERPKLPENYLETLKTVTKEANEELLNPVYLSVDEDGTLLLD